MTKSTVKTSVVLAALLGLAACGSSGGGSSVSPSPAPAPTPRPAPSPSPAPSPAPAPSSQYKGVHLTAGSNQAHTARAQAYNSNTMNEIQVGSRTVTVKYPGISAGTFNNIGTRDNKMIASDGSLSYSRFGTYFGPNKSDVEITNGARATQTNDVFSMGQVTTNMPTTGTAVYNGLSLGSHTGDVYGEGTSRFNVDFGAKTISGTVSNAAYSADLRGTISGASFSGTHNGVNMSGNFYGPNAAELGGVYNGTSNGRSVVGSFGAKR